MQICSSIPKEALFVLTCVFHLKWLSHDPCSPGANDTFGTR